MGISPDEFCSVAQDMAIQELNFELVMEIEEIKRELVDEFDAKVQCIIDVAEMIGESPIDLLTGAQTSACNSGYKEALEMLTMIKCKIIEDGFYS